MHFTKTLVTGLALSLLTSVASLAQDAELPGGASNLSEVYEAWTVTCGFSVVHDGKKVKRCVLSQRQIAQQTRQRVLTIELRPSEGGATGLLILPFGLELQKGVTYHLDDGQPGATQSFRTCLPAGCLLDIDFDATVIANLKIGQKLNLTATADGGQEMIFSISLQGFSNALNRITELME